MKALTQHNERRAIAMRYTLAYCDKPAPISMDTIVSQRDKLAMIHEIREYQGEAFTLALIAQIIINALKIVHVARPMTAEMCAETAKIITNEFPKMTPADIKFVMSKGVQGVFGPILDRADGALVLSWHRQYWEQMKAAMKARHVKHEDTSSAIPVPDEIAKLSERLRIKKEGEEKDRTMTNKSADEEQTLKDRIQSLANYYNEREY